MQFVKKRMLAEYLMTELYLHLNTFCFFPFSILTAENFQFTQQNQRILTVTVPTAHVNMSLPYKAVICSFISVRVIRPEPSLSDISSNSWWTAMKEKLKEGCYV